MKELAEEHRIHLQRLRNEVDAAAREKQQLGRQLEAEKAQLARQVRRPFQNLIFFSIASSNRVCRWRWH